MSERQLPHNLEAEQSLLGAILVDYEASSSAFQILTAEDFYSPRHQRIFAAIQDIYDRESRIDEILLAEELNRRSEDAATGGLEYLDELVRRLPAAANAEYYARIIYDRAILRNLVKICGEVAEEVYDSRTSAQEQQDRAEQKILEIGRRQAGREFVSIKEVLDKNFERMHRDDLGEDTIRTGYPDLDNLTMGLHPSELVIVAGRPSMGKTSFVLNIVRNATLSGEGGTGGKSVAIFSLEVARDQVVQNLLCMHSQVDSHRLRNKQFLSPEIWKKLIDGASELAATRIFIDDTPNLSPLTLKAKARRLHSREGIDLIVIDYLQLMEARGMESRQQEISLISRSLKGLARELEIPVVTISQLSRGVESREDRRPRMADLRESGAIEQDADLILMLYRDEYYHPEREDAEGRAEVIIAKQRNGPTGKVELVFRKECMRFESRSVHQGAF
ncbi:MAG: replicative DNA helicase [Planctomycetota bacterium]|nr:replicative DNA helicase [Planctomycetota bacterium]